MNTITVKYSGGLGNVLFQIAAVIAYSNKFDRTFIFSKYNSLSNLDNCNVENMGIDCAEYEKSLQDIPEDQISCYELFTGAQHLRLVGFFQNYRLFDKYKPQILTILGIPIIRKSVEPIMQMPGFSNMGIFKEYSSNTIDFAKNAGDEVVGVRGFAGEISLEQSNTEEGSKTERCDSGASVTVSLHIRRGDYEKLRCYFILLDEYYYKRALLAISNQLSPLVKIKVLCFYERISTSSAKRIISDLEMDADIRKCSIEFHHFNDILFSGESFDSGVKNERRNCPITDIEEMAIMSHCSHHIIANSTYSWWSAYINPRKDKIVCYPDEYFNHQLYYLESNGLKVDGWTPVESWNQDKYRCNCRLTPVNHYNKKHKENSC